MDNGRHRVLLIGSHPVQYSSPAFRKMAQHPKLDILVAYLSLHGTQAELDAGFGVKVQWDIPLFEGYPWVHVPNRSLRPRIEHFWGLINPGLWTLVREGHFDAVVAFTGYAYASFWIALAAAKFHGIPILFGTDATSIQTRGAGKWKIPLKRILLPRVFGLASVVIVASTAGKSYVESLGIAKDRVVVTPFVVDNDWWRAQAARVNREAVRSRWGIPKEAPVMLFCAKLQQWKRPQDVLRAFAKVNMSDAYLVFAGEGPLRAKLESEAQALGVAERVRFLGFTNQSELPDVYRSSDLLVLPSEYDPCPAVVCESMLCQCPVVLSDEIRGRFDLVRDGETGYIFPCGEVEALRRILAEALSDRVRLREMGIAASKRMDTWSHRENIEGFLEAIERSQTRKYEFSTAAAG